MLNTIFEQYKRLVKSTTGVTLDDYAGLTDASAQFDLKATVEKVETLISTSTDLTDGFKEILCERMKIVKDTLHSPWINPHFEVNQFCWEIFQTFFPNNSLFNYIKTLDPQLDKILITDRNVDDGVSQTVFYEVSLTPETVQQYLLPNEFFVINNTVVPLSQITRHRDTLKYTEAQISQHLRLLEDIFTELNTSTNEKLKECLFRHPDINKLFSALREFLGLEPTLREALDRFKQKLAVCGVRHSENDEELRHKHASTEAIRLALYLEKIPNASTIFEDIRIQNGEIPNLLEFLKLLINDIDQAIVKGPRLLETCLNASSHLLAHKPQLSSYHAGKLKTALHQFWEKKSFTWGLTRGDLPPAYLKVFVAHFKIESINQLIAILIHSNHPAFFELLLSNATVAILVKANLPWILIQLNDMQINYFFRAIAQNAIAIAPSIYSINDLNTLLRELRHEYKVAFCLLFFKKILQNDGYQLQIIHQFIDQLSNQQPRFLSESSNSANFVENFLNQFAEHASSLGVKSRLSQTLGKGFENTVDEVIHYLSSSKRYVDKLFYLNAFAHQHTDIFELIKPDSRGGMKRALDDKEKDKADEPDAKRFNAQ